MIAPWLFLFCAVWASPQPTPLADTRRRVATLLPAGQRLVTSQGLAQIYLHDLDGDNQPEVFALTLQGGHGQEMEELAAFGRVFEGDTADTRFRLLIFTGRPAALTLSRVVDLGTWRVLAALTVRSISRDLPYPLGLTFVFQTQTGAEHVWVVVPRDPRAEPSRAVFHETLSTEVSVLDVDGDGLLDVTTADRVREPTGRYETYLTWYRWTGRDYREHASTVVVRNLVQFLARTRGQLLDHAYDALVRDALEPGAVQGYRRAGLDARAVISRFFPPAGDLDRIRDLVLPDLRDNPFRIPSEAPVSVVLSVRVIDDTGTSHFVDIIVAAARNPFQPRQFSLLPASGDGESVDTPPSAP